ncbi:hypothetical protein Tcan_03412 [Toxocara canis]|uniref:Uncharacterized protein n=1 Tax=Toxocara canis TaxID=6265 RepID=A0A0B2UN90_TOXCA|nr:hypothetical protein Tcan_03412 [Toxocara canis]
MRVSITRRSYVLNNCQSTMMICDMTGNESNKMSMSSLTITFKTVSDERLAYATSRIEQFQGVSVWVARWMNNVK